MIRILQANGKPDTEDAVALVFNCSENYHPALYNHSEGTILTDAKV